MGASAVWRRCWLCYSYGGRQGVPTFFVPDEARLPVDARVVDLAVVAGVVFHNGIFVGTPVRGWPQPYLGTGGVVLSGKPVFSVGPFFRSYVVSASVPYLYAVFFLAHPCVGGRMLLRGGYLLASDHPSRRLCDVRLLRLAFVYRFDPTGDAVESLNEKIPCQEKPLGRGS